MELQRVHKRLLQLWRFATTDNRYVIRPDDMRTIRIDFEGNSEIITPSGEIIHRGAIKSVDYTKPYIRIPTDNSSSLVQTTLSFEDYENLGRPIFLEERVTTMYTPFRNKGELTKHLAGE